MSLTDKFNIKKHNAQKNRIFLLGIDGADLDIIKSLINKGELPAFSKLLETGTSSPLLSPIIANSAPSWASIFTGKDIAEHGILYFQNQFEDRVEFFDLFLDTIDGERVWAGFDKDNRVSCIINVPITFPPEKVNGVMISGRLANDNSIFTYPPELTNDLNTIGYHPTFDSSKSDVDLFNILDKRIDVALEFIRDYNWDMFFQGFLIIDWIMHHFSEDSLLKQVKEKSDLAGFKIVSKAYKRMDYFLGELLDKYLSPDDRLFIFSDHGFKRYDFMFNVNIWLIKNGYLVLKRPPGMVIRDWLLYFPIKIKRAVFGQKNVLGIRQPVFDWKKNIDWKKTTVYSPEFFVNCSSFRINPYLKLKTEEKNKIIEGLIEQLSSVTLNEKPVFEQFHKREEIFNGRYFYRMPELLGMLEANVRNDKRIYGKGEIFTVKNSVEHRREGVFFAWGKDIKKAELNYLPDVRDIFPTVRYSAGLPVHRNISGKVIEEIFSESFLKLNELQISDDELKPEITVGERYDDTLKERLKDLGYL
ncbi:MAG: alkaline phosphatase family protein [bacterium]|nr:alkaline phosphatase family protein [bacterium]